MPTVQVRRTFICYPCQKSNLCLFWSTVNMIFQQMSSACSEVLVMELWTSGSFIAYDVSGVPPFVAGTS